MQTHRDNDAQTGILAALQEKARRMELVGDNKITAGTGELELGKLKVESEHMTVRRLPADPLAVRVSIGEAGSPGAGWLVDSGYLVFRGSPGKAREILARACRALDAYISDSE